MSGFLYMTEVYLVNLMLKPGAYELYGSPQASKTLAGDKGK